jgi:uncharacterized protein with PQ loop repeat
VDTAYECALVTGEGGGPRMEQKTAPCGIREWVFLPMSRNAAVHSVGAMDLAVLAGVLSTGLFAMSYLPMLVKAARTKDLSSYSLGNIAITNVGNAVHSVYVFSLPLGPIWFLHTFYLVASALMLMWFLRYRATWQRRASNTAEASLASEPERVP